MKPTLRLAGTVRVVPLSAMNEEALWRRAEDLLAALQGSVGVPWEETARVLADDLGCAVADLPEDEPLVDLGVSPAALASLVHGVERAVAALGRGSLGRLTITDLRRALAGPVDRPEVALEDVAFTLACGRDPMPRRLAVVAGTVGQLRDRIAGWLAGRAPEGVHTGVAEAMEGAAPTSPEELAAFWARGGLVDWDAMFAGDPVRRLSLPTYRFAARRHWVEAPEGTPPVVNAPEILGKGGAVAADQPSEALVEKRPSGGAPARWVVAPGDAAVREHVVDGMPTLPGVVHLSRMYAAAQAYTTGLSEVREVVWVRTATVPQDGLGLAVSCVSEGAGVRTAITAGLGGPDAQAMLSEGTWSAPEAVAERRIDVTAALAACAETHDADDFYRALAARGLGYGPLYRGVRELHVAEDRVVAEFASERGVDEVLDPTVLDAALQSVAGLHLAETARSGGTVLPFALDRFTLRTGLPARGWIVTRRLGECYDLDITDQDGVVAAEVRGLRVRRRPDPATGARVAHATLATDGSAAGDASGPITALPRWVPAAKPSGPAARGGTALVIAGRGVSDSVVDELMARYSGTTALARPGTADVPSGPWEDVWFLIGAPGTPGTSGAGAGSASQTVVDAFRTVRALIDYGVLSAAVRFTVVLPDIFGIQGHIPEHPLAAGVLGLVRSLSREVHGPETRCVSVGGPLDDALLDRVAQEPPLESGHDVVLTSDGRHVRELIPIDLRSSDGSAFRDGGRYVITGGLGGIGFELARYLCRRHHARVVLTGRRAADTGVRERLAELDSLGGRVEYRAVDAADAPAMRALLTDLRRDGQLHGVVHSAFVLDDAILERQTKERFTAALRPKIDGTAHLLDALVGERPDFVLIMGSTQSFVGAPGQANYAAASTGMDALALWGRRALGLPVRVVHWSHWGSVGAVARPGYAASLGAAGWRPIETAEGMDLLERFLATDLPCLVGAKAEPSTLEMIGLRADSGRADSEELLALDTVDADAYDRVEGHLTALAAARLQGVRDVAPAARRHVAALRAVTAEFAAGGTVAGPEDMDVPAVPPLACRLDLARACAERVAEYASGALTAHDVVFPVGEPDMLARFYHEEPFNDRAQRVLADEVLRLAEERRREGRPALTILEVGAGTGSTTTHVVERLRDAGLGVRYHVTDVSDRLLDQARDRIGTYGVTYSRLDLGAPGDLARYGEVDVVVAGNVLHAVPDLDAVLGRLRALLRPDGVLLLSELVRTSVFHTIVFGMFDAWWPEGDEARRQPHSPLLDAAAWRDRLGAVGFGPVHATGIGPRGGRAVQAVLLALKGPTTPPPIRIPSGGDMKDAEPDQRADPGRRADPRSAGASAGPDVRAWVRGTIVRVTTDTLGMAGDEFATDTPFATIGVDSLVGVELVGAIGGELGVRLKTLVVFDHPTVDRLADHIVDVHADELRPPGREPAAASPDLAPVHPQVTIEPHTDGTVSARAVVFDAPGDVGDLTVRGIEVRSPGEGEIEVVVAAFPVNFSDGLVARGLYPMMPDFPVVPGVELSGTVSRVGPGVDTFAPGDAVLALTPPEMGGQATSVIVDTDFVVRKPAGVSHEDACGLPAAHLAMSLALDTAGLRAGETVVITGAAGNNGLVAVQLARGRDARVIGTAGSPAKVEYLRSLGVEALNYAEDDLPARLRELTGGAETGADVVINTLGGEAIQQAMRLVGPGGRYVETAVFGLRATGPLDLSAFVHNQSFHSLNAKKYFLDHPKRRAEYLARFADDLASGAVRATTAAVYDFADVREAYLYKQDRALIGRVVVRMDEAPAAAVPVPARESAAAALPDTRRDDIAIVGMSARYAGARDPDELWELLASGRDVCTTVPDGRWDRVRYVSADRDRLDTTYCDHGYFVDGIDEFDASFFGMSSHEAAQTDPQQRVFLQEAWRALEVAGMTRSRARAARVGVFAGAGPSGYEKRMDATGAVRRAQSFWGNDSSVLASRISYVLDLSGPSVSINTACSSSLVAIHTACRSIVDGDCDTALAGGVFLMLDPQYLVVASNGGMLAPDGRCKTFAATADGFGPGEGAGVVVLRRLSDALRDGDHVWGVIRGSAINQDGRTNGITAPSGTAQTAVVRAAHARAGVDARSIGYVEAHGTGTRLGDPIEIEALTNAFGAGPDHGSAGGTASGSAAQCLVGSAKTVIGHTAAAAGVAGVIKVCLAFDRGEVPVSPNGEPGNPLIDFDGGPFRVARGEQWPSAGPRRAGVSSFGFSGTNAHAVLEESVPRPAVAGAPGPWLFPVTAEEPDLLRARLDALAAWLGARGGRYVLADIAHTLQSRRDHGPVRCAVGAGSVDELVAVLGTVGEGEVRIPAGLAGAEPAVRRFIADADEPWPEAERTEGQAVPVPARPLRRERYWFPEDAQWHRHRGGVPEEEQSDRLEVLVDRMLAGEIDEDEVLSMFGDLR
ncbi:SDR family NAD(P)-dependent oxidoreductase [Nocardiopsis sp. JB363]|uniref:SDR family NAD(P)-dependent oxidoreductase n=1 Tax=Nocardiopsis sp. JB363 TaxID=1434837 RepID=UPI000979D829|nr:SDR family NAD(P)-dependent oxidoreductase [Nocardiopsis sp. JB363]SIO84432.1 Malonyl CoA-acyl carrier protein transacylase [Nocardiopsis sp. JB363]